MLPPVTCQSKSQTPPLSLTLLDLILSETFQAKCNFKSNQKRSHQQPDELHKTLFLDLTDFFLPALFSLPSLFPFTASFFFFSLFFLQLFLSLILPSLFLPFHSFSSFVHFIFTLPSLLPSFHSFFISVVNSSLISSPFNSSFFLHFFLYLFYSTFLSFLPLNCLFYL